METQYFWLIGGAVVAAAVYAVPPLRRFALDAIGQRENEPRRGRNRHEPPHVETRVPGLLVRSRAEAAIANWLYAEGLRFEYERPVGVKNWRGRPSYRTVDFYLPSLGVYWEHFGMWDDPIYQRKNRGKLRMYREMGYPLVATFGSTPPTPQEMRRKLEEAMRTRRAG